jgi:hypothetical protein
MLVDKMLSIAAATKREDDLSIDNYRQLQRVYSFLNQYE